MESPMTLGAPSRQDAVPRVLASTGDHADAELRTRDTEGTERASCALWWRRRMPAIDGLRVGLIGRYASVDACSGERLLRRACAELAAHGCALAVGPMDGSTWNAFRFVTWRGSEPRFAFEPDNDDDWPRQFERCGFAAVQRYRSALQTDLAVEAPRVARTRQRMATAGITVREVDLHHFDDELARLHALVMAGFARQPFFTPLTVDAFVARHRPLRPLLHPGIALVAERRDAPIALLLAFPDPAQASRGERVDTVVVKTVVAQPGRYGAGVAHDLLVRSTALARECGYRRWIHALMRDSCASANWSARCAATIRRYALYGRSLAR